MSEFKPKYHIAVDIGAGSSRVFASWMDENGKLQLDELHRFDTGDMVLLNKHVRNIYRWHEEILTGFKKFTQKYGGEAVSIGVDAFAKDTMLMDKHGNIIGMLEAYRYYRADPETLKYMDSVISNEDIYYICGNQTGTNDPLLVNVDRFRKDPDLRERVGGLLFIPDIFHYWLTGYATTEHSNANYSKMFSQADQTWSDKLFKLFNLPDALKMPVAKFGDKLGKVLPEICEEVGFTTPPEVITPCTHDTGSAVLVIPDMEPDSYFISSGSWSLLGLRLKKYVMTKETYDFNCSNGGMPFDWNLFKCNIDGMWLLQCCQREWKDYSFSEIVEKACEVGENKYYFDPDHKALYNPDCMSQTISDFIYETYGERIDPNDVGRIALACYESLALKYRYSVDSIGGFTGVKAGRIYVFSGGSRNNLLNQYTSNACNLPVYAGIPEASVVGNALCQMYGAGEVADEPACKKIVRDTFHMDEFLPQDREKWEQKYADFRRDVLKK